MSLTQGQWKYSQWGEPSISVPSGAELWTWFSNESQLDSIWPQTTRALSGLFCASLNFMNNELSVQPKNAYRPLGVLLFNSTQEKNNNYNGRLRYSALPSEIVCTENLTPWAKLLPCGKYKGLAKLLSYPNKLFDTKYHSMGIHFRHVCLDTNCNEIGVELKQTLSLVIDSEISMRQSLDGYLKWSLESLFSVKLDSLCPIADKSIIYIDSLNQDLKLDPQPNQIINIDKRKFNIFDLKSIFVSQTSFNLIVNYQKSSINSISTNLIYAHRYSTSMNQFTNGFETIIRNPSENSIRLTYFENIPWYFRVYLNTLKIKDSLSGDFIEPSKRLYNNANVSELLNNFLLNLINLSLSFHSL